MIPEALHEFARVLPEPVVLLSPEGYIRSANPALARLLGQAPRLLEGADLCDYVTESRAEVTAYLDQCARSGEVVLGALHMRRGTGEAEPYRCEGAMLRLEDEPLVLLRLRLREAASSRFLLLNRQIAELGRQVHERMRVEQELRQVQGELEVRVAQRTRALSLANAELQRSNESLQGFAAIASHDLREPLRKIISFGDLLREELGDRLDADSGDLLARMQSAAQRMHAFILNLLEYSRVSSSPNEFVPVNLKQVVDDVLADLELRIAETGATVEVGPLPLLEADPGQMYQLIQNLVSNALKFSRSGEAPVVRITSKAEDVATAADGEARVYHVSISDRGIGFDQSAAERIFDLFQRLHSRTTYEGTGIGLAICRRIAERHGGTIRAESRPGEGTTFTVTLPEKQSAALMAEELA